MDYKTYRKNTFEELDNFDRTFHPWKKWQNIKLTDLCPCYTCEVKKELNSRQYEIMMSGGLEEEITKPCKACVDGTLWQMDCIDKLKWYEDNDERLKQKDG